MPDDVLEIRWHGRGGQGVKTAAMLFAEAAFEGGKFIQGFSDYGPERSGAPIQGFTRVSDKPITLHNFITEPDVVVILDPTLLGTVPVAEGLRPGGKVLVNSSRDPAEVAAVLGVDASQVYVVDAKTISLEVMGRDMPNSPMIGALVKVLGTVELPWVNETFEKKFGAKSKTVVETNVAAIKRAYDEVRGTSK
ncbi:MAG: 2-oxoacid:acceptor oxidoreductase family protein [Candidatus Coatesbacteria bacterium]|nr:MAG: 2-oxoacid:acceptor oxidoreductase family protein [Candidatus Coatesbacteria bacterium]